MLSYQHIYHAGGPADLHKHSILCAVLEKLRHRHRALTYMETHAGRGLYDLRSPEAEKTSEAAAGWLVPGTADKVPPQFLDIVRSLNNGELAPLYPGSPLVAARLLRPQDKIHLMELHPQEFEALSSVFKDDDRVTLDKTDGYEGVLARCPPAPRSGMVLIDPSYEIKDEYLQAAAFTERLRHKWREGTVMLWYPLLPAGRHVEMLKEISLRHEDSICNEYKWSEPGGEDSGMYGSGIVLLNFPGGLKGFTGF